MASIVFGGSREGDRGFLLIVFSFSSSYYSLNKYVLAKCMCAVQQYKTKTKFIFNIFLIMQVYKVKY